MAETKEILGFTGVDELRCMMDDQSGRHLERVVDLLIEGRLYLLAGAGLSCRVGIPEWYALLDEFSREYKKRPGHSAERAREIERFAENHNLELFEVMKNDTQGVIALIDVLKKHFKNEKCDDIHRELLMLPFRGLVTTNYDTCFENACRKYKVHEELIDNRWFCFPEYAGQNIDMDRVFDGERFLLHMHGCFYHGKDFEVENIILTPSQYIKFYRRNEMQMILRELGNQHVLLLGTSFTDHYFLDSIRDLRKPKTENERANTPEWYIFYNKNSDCHPIRDEEDFVMHHIYYEPDGNGFSDTIMKVVEAVGIRKRPVSTFVDPSKVGMREDLR